MSALCVLADGVLTVYAVSAFTLAWTHSVERLRIEEDWRVDDGALVAVEARLQGSGAGMEPGEDASFDGRWWRWRPSLPPQEVLRLARSGDTGAPWQLCLEDGCWPVAREGPAASPAELRACDATQ